MAIARYAVDEYLGRRLDSFLWMKRLTRDQVLRHVLGLAVRPRFKTDPWLHQLVCFWIGLHYPRFLWLLDMGSGKTKIILDIYTQLLREGKVDRALVTVPRKINVPSWVEDVARHSDLEPWPIATEDIEEKWDMLMRPKGDIVIVNNQGLQLAMCKKEKDGKGRSKTVPDEKKFKELRKRYNFLAMDEIHKLANHDNLWFMIFDRLSKETEYCYGATGTAFGKRVEDLWTQFYLVDRGETLGPNLGPFRAAFFDSVPDPWKGIKYRFRKDMDGELHNVIQHRSIRYEESELQDLPRQVPRQVNLDMGTEQKEHYLRALEGLINAGGSLRELEGAYVRMRQIISGYLAWKDDHGDHVLRFKENPKLDWLEGAIDEMGDSKVVIVYWFTETGRMIVDRLKEMKVGVEWLYGGTKDHEALRRRFLDDPARTALVVQADAGGTGLDGLQKVARYMVMYETPTSPTERKQMEKRIHRPGKTSRSFVYDLIMRRSMDRGILEDIQAGIDTYNAVVNGRGRKRGFFLGD